MQPHRYSRLKNLFEDFCKCFNEADIVIISDIYAAGETPIDGVSKDILIHGVQAHGHRKVMPLERPEDLALIINNELISGDFVVCLGAGDITNWANNLPTDLMKFGNGLTSGGLL